MYTRLKTSLLAALALAVLSAAVIPLAGQQAPPAGRGGAAGQGRGAQPAGRGAATRVANIKRTSDGKPDFNGVWQTNNTANWDIQDHNAMAGPFYQMGAIGAIPAGQGVVEGNDIPYTADAAKKKRENYGSRWTLDPEVKCYMPGIPRATYMPYPFHIVQSPQYILFAYEYATANRVVNMLKPTEPPVDSWMGWSNGKWEGDTLVVEVTGLNGQAWLDRAGNFTSDSAKVTERYTPIDNDHINYEVTIEDPKTFTRPWKMSMPIYRRIEKNAQLLEFKCVEFAEEMLYGHLRKK
jgi:hypothetical protein